MHLERTEYERIIRVLPSVCVDILIADDAGRVPLLKHSNQPRICQ